MLAIALAALARAARSLASMDAGSARDSARALAAIRTLARAVSNKGESGKGEGEREESRVASAESRESAAG